MPIKFHGHVTWFESYLDFLTSRIWIPNYLRCLNLKLENDLLTKLVWHRNIYIYKYIYIYIRNFYATIAMTSWVWRFTNFKRTSFIFTHTHMHIRLYIQRCIIVLDKYLLWSANEMFITLRSNFHFVYNSKLSFKKELNK